MPCLARTTTALLISVTLVRTIDRNHGRSKGETWNGQLLRSGFSAKCPLYDFVLSALSKARGPKMVSFFLSILMV